MRGGVDFCGIEAGLSGGSDDLLIRVADQIISDVPLDALIEEYRLLAHNAEGATQVMQVIFLDINSVDEDRARAGLIEPQQKANNCRLPRARLP